MLERLRQAVVRNDNVFAVLMDAVRCCSLGQITHALFEVGGQYRREHVSRRASGLPDCARHAGRWSTLPDALPEALTPDALRKVRSEFACGALDPGQLVLVRELPARDAVRGPRRIRACVPPAWLLRRAGYGSREQSTVPLRTISSAGHPSDAGRSATRPIRFPGCCCITRVSAAGSPRSARRTTASGRPGRGRRRRRRCASSRAAWPRWDSGAATTSRSSATTARASTGRWPPPRRWAASRCRSTRTPWRRRWCTC